MDSSVYAYSPSSANVVEFPRPTASEDRAPYDAAPRFDPGFVILPAQFKDVPPTTDIGDGRGPIKNGDMRAVYSVLASYTGDSNVVYPSVATIAETLGYSEWHVKRVIKALLIRDLISKQRRYEGGMNQSNAYTLTHHKSPNGRSVAQHPTSGALTPMVGCPDTDGRVQGTQEEEPREPDKRTENPFDSDEHPMLLPMRLAICEAFNIDSLSGTVKTQMDALCLDLINTGANPMNIPHIVWWASSHTFWGKGYSWKQLPSVYQQWVTAGRKERRRSVFTFMPESASL